MDRLKTYGRSGTVSMVEMVCECGHSISEQHKDACLFYDDATNTMCGCNLRRPPGPLNAETKAEQRIAALEARIADLQATLVDIVDGKIRIADTSHAEVANEFNVGFGGDPIEGHRPYAYRDGSCIECGCADGGHYGDCQAVN